MVACSNSLPLLNRHLFAFACVFVCLRHACVFVAFDIDQGGNRRIDTRGFQAPPPCSVLLETALEFSLLFSAMRQFGEYGLLCTHSHKKLNASLQDELVEKQNIVFHLCRWKKGPSVMTFSKKEQTCKSSNIILIDLVSPIMFPTFSFKMYVLCKSILKTKFVSAVQQWQIVKAICGVKSP